MERGEKKEDEKRRGRGGGDGQNVTGTLSTCSHLEGGLPPPERSQNPVD